MSVGLANDKFINNGLSLNADKHTYKLSSVCSYLKQSNLLFSYVYIWDLEGKSAAYYNIYKNI